jgi:BTB/POZ domain
MLNDTRALGNEIVTIHVGPKRKAFTIHKKLFCDRSDFFSKAFNGGFQEAGGMMYLPDDEVKGFEGIVNFIYRDSLPPFRVTNGPDDGRESHRFELDTLYPLFCLAEKYCMNELANRTMDAVQDFGWERDLIPGSKSLEFIYNNTHDESKLRLYGTLTRLYRRALDEERKKDVDKLAALARQLPDFAADYVTLQFEHRARLRHGSVADPQIRGGPKGFGRCFFHTHAKGEICHLEEAEPANN